MKKNKAALNHIMCKIILTENPLECNLALLEVILNGVINHTVKRTLCVQQPRGGLPN